LANNFPANPAQRLARLRAMNTRSGQSNMDDIPLNRNQHNIAAIALYGRAKRAYDFFNRRKQGVV
jgi:hypothetical protein